MNEHVSLFLILEIDDLSFLTKEWLAWNSAAELNEELVRIYIFYQTFFPPPTPPRFKNGLQ